jgi:hypothetical protein
VCNRQQAFILQWAGSNAAHPTRSQLSKRQLWQWSCLGAWEGPPSALQVSHCLCVSVCMRRFHSQELKALPADMAVVSTPSSTTHNILKTQDLESHPYSSRKGSEPVFSLPLPRWHCQEHFPSLTPFDGTGSAFTYNMIYTKQCLTGVSKGRRLFCPFYRSSGRCLRSCIYQVVELRAMFCSMVSFHCPPPSTLCANNSGEALSTCKASSLPASQSPSTPSYSLVPMTCLTLMTPPSLPLTHTSKSIQECGLGYHQAVYVSSATGRSAWKFSPFYPVLVPLLGY